MLKVVDPIPFADILKHRKLMQGWKINYYDNGMEMGEGEELVSGYNLQVHFL